MSGLKDRLTKQTITFAHSFVIEEGIINVINIQAMLKADISVSIQITIC